MLKIVDSNQEAKEIRYAGFWVRLVAFILDGIIIALIIYTPLAITLTIYFFANVKTVLLEFLIGLFLTSLWRLIICVIYTVKLVASEKQSTFAMRWFDLIIVNKNMQRLSLGRSFARYVVQILVNIFTIGIGYLVIVFRKDKRGLHDLIAGTYVIYKIKKDEN